MHQFVLESFEMYSWYRTRFRVYRSRIFFYDWFSTCVDHAYTEHVQSSSVVTGPFSYVQNKKEFFLLAAIGPDATIATNYPPQEVYCTIKSDHLPHPHIMRKREVSWSKLFGV